MRDMTTLTLLVLGLTSLLTSAWRLAADVRQERAIAGHLGAELAVRNRRIEVQERLLRAAAVHLREALPRTPSDE